MLGGPCNELDRSRLVRCGRAGLRGARMQARALFAKRKPIKGLAFVRLDLLVLHLHEPFSFKLSAERDDWLHQLQPIDATRTESVGAERILSFG